jgi:hypothetical protein
MSWGTIAEFAIQRQWLYTPPTQAEWFKVLQLQPPYDRQLQVCQFDGESSFLEPVLVLSGWQSTLIHVPINPAIGNPRKVGFRLPPSAPYEPLWSIQVLSNPEIMPLVNPVSVTVTPATSGTATPYPKTSLATVQTLIAANANRKGVTLWNNSTAALYLAFGADATLTAYAVKVDAGGYYELPFGFTGAVTGLWATANGSALIWEFV